MPEGARVESLDALEGMKRAIWKFSETAVAALGDSESEMHRLLIWLEHEQRSYWQDQIRKRQDLVVRAAERVREKKLFKDSTGRLPSAIEEEKALAIAKRRLEEAEHKLIAVKKYVPLLQREIQQYKGSIQRLATTVQVDLPAAAHQLSALLGHLEKYVSLQASGGQMISSDTPSTDVQSEAPPPPEEGEKTS